MNTTVLRRVIRRNAGGNGCLPGLLIILSVIWLTIGIVSIQRAPAIWGGVLMAVLGTLFSAAAVLLVVQQHRRIGRGALDRHPLVMRLERRDDDRITRVVDEPRADGRGHRRRALRFVSRSGSHFVLYPTFLESLIILEVIRRSDPEIRLLRDTDPPSPD